MIDLKVEVARRLASDKGIPCVVIFILLKQLKLLMLSNNKAMTTIKVVRCSSGGLNCLKVVIHQTRTQNPVVLEKPGIRKFKAQLR